MEGERLVWNECQRKRGREDLKGIPRWSRDIEIRRIMRILLQDEFWWCSLHLTFPRPGDRVPFAPSPHPSLTILSNFNFNPSVEGNSLFNNLVTALLSRWNEGWKFVDCFQPLLEEGTVKKDELSSVKNIRHESFSLNLRDTESRTIHSYLQVLGWKFEVNIHCQPAWEGCLRPRRCIN